MDIKFATAPDTPPSLEEVKEGSLQPEGRQIDTIESSIKTQSTMAAAEVGGTSAEQALQPPKPKVTEQVFNAAQRIAEKLHRELQRQSALLRAIINKQIELTGQDPIRKDEAASKTVEKATASGTAIKPEGEGPPKAVAGTSPAAKTSRLSSESEAVLLTLFGVQDMLGREDAQVLAQQAGCSESQVREYFTKLRSNVRSFMQRLQRKATSADTPTAKVNPPALPVNPPTASLAYPPCTKASAGPPGMPSQPLPSQPQPGASQPAPVTPSPASPSGTAPSGGPQQALGVPVTTGAYYQSYAALGKPPGDPATGMHALLADMASARQLSSAETSTSAPVKEEAAAAMAMGPSMEEVVLIDAAKKAGLEELQRYLDASGGIASAKFAGPVASLMSRTSSAEVREALLQALLRTASQLVLHQLGGSSRAFETLDAWARWAEADKQTTLLRLLLKVLQRIPVPAALLKASSLQRTVGRLQKYRTPDVATAANALLQHWYQQEYPHADFLAAAASMPRPPPPPVRVNAPAQASRPSVAVQSPRVSQPMPVFKPGESPRSATLQPRNSAAAYPSNNAPPPPAAAVTASFQQSQGQAEVLKPSQMFYRGVAGRMGSGEKATQPRSPGKVLSADEIVRAKERERSRSASAAGLSARPGPSKSSRLDANALLDMASHRRVAPRPGVPPPHLSQERVSSSPMRASQQAFPGRQQQQHYQQQHQQQQQQQQQQHSLPHRANAISHHHSVPVQSHPAFRGAPQQRPPQQAQQRAQPPQQGTDAWMPSVAWVGPPPVARLPAQEKPPATGEESKEALMQRVRHQTQPEATYGRPELIPSSPSEPEDFEHGASAQMPARVPIFPVDPLEREQHLQLLQAAGVPVPPDIL